MFKITRGWLNQFSKNGKSGWNKKQLALIGLDWPPHAGWMYSVIGKELENEKKREFESLQGQSIEGIKVQRGLANMAENPVYQTIPDGKGSWTGRWLSDARWPWCK